MLPFRRKRSESTPTSAEAEPSAKANSGLLSRLRAGLKRTGSGIGQLFLGRKQIDAELLDELETLLLTADVGI